MKLISALLFTSLCRATIPAGAAWEVRPTLGASTNGCGFVTGATGTDYSQNNNKNATACTNCGSSTANLSTTDAVSAGTTTITSATAAFSSAIVGDIVYFSGGTGSIAAQRRQVTAFTNVTTITIDASIAASTGMTMNIGGACDDLATVFATGFVASNKAFVMNSGTLTRTAGITLVASQTPDRTHPYNMIIGYNATRGDCSGPQSCAGRPTIQLTSGSNVHVIDGNGVQGWAILNLIVDCNSQTGATGIFTSTFWVVGNNKVMNCKSDGIYAAQNDQELIYSNEVSGGPTGCDAGINANGQGTMITGNWVHDYVCNAIVLGSYDHAILNLITNISGGTAAGISLSGSNTMTVLSNTIYSTAGACIDASGTSTFIIAAMVRNNVLSNCGTYGLNGSVSGATCGSAAQPWYDGNAFYAPGTANRHCVDDTGTVNAINGASPYTNTLDKTLTASPFTNAAGGDFSLNNTAGGGAAARGAAWPGALPGVSQTGFMDFGALQSQAAAATVPGAAFTQ